MKNFFQALKESPLAQKFMASRPEVKVAISFIAVLVVVLIALVIIVFNYKGFANEGAETPAPVAEHSVATGQIVVKFKSGVSSSTIARIMQENNLTLKEVIPGIDTQVLYIDETRDTVQEVTQRLKMKEAANIDYTELDEVAEPDFIPNDTYYSKQWHLKKISAPAAWDMAHGSSSVIIAILDTGVKSAHEDLAGKIVAGWNTYDNNANTEDVYGHGTAVAGSAAAITNNSRGIAGPGFEAKIMPMRISDSSGLGYGSTIAAALIWAADHGARVANVSFNIDFSSTVTSAAKYFMSKGGVVTMSAGNNSRFSPLATDNPYILTIGATDSQDNIASWSNTGGNIDLVAPGAGIYTLNRSSTLPYSSWSGTSFSAPITAGVASLVIAANPALTADEIQTLIKQSADDLGDAGYDMIFGWGRLNAEKAIRLANPSLILTETPVDTVNPTVTITSPAANATLTGTVNVTVNAADNVGVKKALLYVDGKNVSLSTVAPFSIIWDTTATSTGAHVIFVRAYDAANNSKDSAKITVNTIAPTIVDTLTISNFAITSKTSNSATIEWTTNLSSTGSLNYGATGAMGTAANSALTGTKHSVVLTGLAASTIYSYQITAKSGTQTVTSDVSSFLTETEVPIIEGLAVTSLAVTSISTSTATIEWSANVSTTGTLKYGLTSSLGSTISDPVSALQHVKTLTNLKPATAYYYQVTYIYGNDIVMSEVSTFTTEKLSPSTVVDVTKPVIAFVGYSSISLNVFSTFVDPGVTATDNIDGDITAKVIAKSNVNPNVLGTYQVTYNVTDAAGNIATQKTRTVKVVDSVKPVVTLIGSKYLSIPVFSTYTELGATSTDNYDGDMTSKIVMRGSVNTSITGTYYITYTVTDSSGKIGVATRVVKVIDYTKPVLTISGDSTVSLKVGSAYADAGATANDNYDGDLTAKITAVSTVNTSVVGTYYVTYSVSDAQGNKTTAKRTVKVLAQ